MIAYIIRRIFILIPTLLGVSVLVFLMLHLTPGDPAELLMGERASEEALQEIREHLGLLLYNMKVNRVGVRVVNGGGL